MFQFLFVVDLLAFSSLTKAFASGPYLMPLLRFLPSATRIGDRLQECGRSDPWHIAQQRSGARRLRRLRYGRRRGNYKLVSLAIDPRRSVSIGFACKHHLKLVPPGVGLVTGFADRASLLASASTMYCSVSLRGFVLVLSSWFQPSVPVWAAESVGNVHHPER
jgi:hypothetical protein